MQIFKTDKTTFWKNELKSWFWTTLTIAVFYFGLKLFFQMTHDKLVIGVIVLLLLKIGDTLTQYHVTEIHIDSESNQLTFMLNSIMSGEKTKQYKLEKATSDLKNNSGVTKYFASPYSLKIFLKPKDTFSLSNRYGFSFETLKQVDRSIKNKNS